MHVCVVHPVDDQAFGQFPALRGRQGRPIDHKADEARRVLWRAFQHGTLTEDELARTLDRIEFGINTSTAATIDPTSYSRSARRRESPGVG
jgi:hypothetical protein